MGPWEHMSDRPQRGIVVGTAGHIDHGKTSLVRALTGVDTDRLPEEKKRGISIDLGFAHLTLPNGRGISFVDVPGHERFIKNMLAGASGIQAVLLIVAADEGVKPQTREHFNICRLLGLQHGFVVLTKCDAVSTDRLRGARHEVEALCQDSFLDGAPIIAASSVTGFGLDAVRTHLEQLTTRIETAREGEIPRLPIDRSFSVKGFGTVVTGTLTGGTLGTGDTVVLYPGAKTLRIRGLQVQGNSVPRAYAGERTAVNLAGIDCAEIKRGDVLSMSNLVEPSRRLAVALDWLPGHDAPGGRERLLLHVGAAEISVRMKTLPSSDSGSCALAEIQLATPVLAFPGDHFILRRPSPADTVAGGKVIDAFPPRRLKRLRVIERLTRLQKATLNERVQILTEESLQGLLLSALERLCGWPATEIGRSIQDNPELFLHSSSQRVLSKLWLRNRQAEVITWLERFHKENPAKTGAPIAMARLGLSVAVAGIVFESLPTIQIQGELISLKTHRWQMTGPEIAMLETIEHCFLAGGFAPPTIDDALKAAVTDQKKARSLLELLIKRDRLVRISDGLVFHADVIAHIRTSLAAHKGRRFTVAEFKEWTQISRKFAIPLLEHLDRLRVTKRDGDYRIVL